MRILKADEQTEKKLKNRIMIICVILMLIACICNAQQTGLTVKDLPALLEKSKTDSILKIERLAALKFHKLLNEYRIANKKQPLLWNDTLWLVGRNHCLWMQAVNKFGHDEFSGNVAFTGETPTKRASYVWSDWSENFKYFVGENAIGGLSDIGKNIEEITTNIAKGVFMGWHKDKPHDDGMLYAGYNEHGAAFILRGGFGVSELAYHY